MRKGKFQKWVQNFQTAMDQVSVRCLNCESVLSYKMIESNVIDHLGTTEVNVFGVIPCIKCIYKGIYIGFKVEHVDSASKIAMITETVQGTEELTEKTLDKVLMNTDDKSLADCQKKNCDCGSPKCTFPGSFNCRKY